MALSEPLRESFSICKAPVLPTGNLLLPLVGRAPRVCQDQRPVTRAPSRKASSLHPSLAKTAVRCRELQESLWAGGDRGLHPPAGDHFLTHVFSPLQPQSKARKPRSKSRSKIDLLKKCTEDKIQLFKEQAPEDLVEKVSVSFITGLAAAWFESTQSPQGL